MTVGYCAAVQRLEMNLQVAAREQRQGGEMPVRKRARRIVRAQPPFLIVRHRRMSVPQQDIKLAKLQLAQPLGRQPLRAFELELHGERDVGTGRWHRGPSHTRYRALKFPDQRHSEFAFWRGCYLVGSL